MKINIGTSIELEKLISTRLLIQAGSGGGKSYALRKVVEAIGDKCQQIILDPEGEFVTLREKFDFALVAKGGDIPLNLKYAETLAHKLLETSLSAIIDLYELKQYERILFVKRFLDALMNAPKELWHSCMVYVDEAHVFCPESSKSESMGSVIDLCTRGRKRGFAAVLATQRLSKLHKDAAAECLNKMIGRTGLDIDRKRAGDELGMINKADMIALRELEPGEFYTFGPAISNEVIKFKVDPVITTHLQAGKKAINVPPTPGAIKKILLKLQDIPEEAEKELQSKQQLQAEVTRLRTELTKVSKSQPVQKVDTSSFQEKINTLQSQLQIEKQQVKKFESVAKDYEKKINTIKTVIGEPITIPEIREVANVAPVNAQPKQPVQRKPSSNLEGVSLPIGEKKTLIACAQYANGVSRVQLTILTAYKRSSRDAYIQRLKEKGFVAQSGDRIIPTDAGIDALGNDYEPLPQGEELQQYWLNNLPQGERAIFEILIKEHPKAVTRESLSEATGYQRSSRDAYIQRMSAKELVVAVGRGEVRASDDLF